MRELRVAFYGDDFTGSVDVMLQLRRAGWRSRLLLGLPSAAALAKAAADVDAVGIAGVARSLPADAIEAEVRPALEALAALGPRVVQYKACSTADSSPDVGSLGRVVEVAREVFGDATVPVLFAQPDFGRFTVFGHHFAAEGGIVHRLDRQPTMSNHPVTPMRESDLAVHLSRQTELPIGGVPLSEYGSGGSAGAAAVARRLSRASEAALVLDAMTDEHVALVAEAIVADATPGTPRFAIGSGGLSTGLGRALGRPDDGSDAAARPLDATGPVLAVSGSRSPQTARQIRTAREAGWTVLALPLGGADPAVDVRDRVLDELGSGRSVVVTTGDDELPGAGAGLVATIAAQLSSLVEAALRAGATRRVIVCGGDTSSRIVTLLGAESLSIAANPVGNVVLCTVGAPVQWLDGAEMLLKGGQVGPADLFELVRTLGA